MAASQQHKVDNQPSATLPFWNNLPPHLRKPELSLGAFKGQLKSHLFSLYLYSVFFFELHSSSAADA